jgi:RNase H-fold protein (predicted Holliday junction resolvase)
VKAARTAAFLFTVRTANLNPAMTNTSPRSRIATRSAEIRAGPRRGSSMPRQNIQPSSPNTIFQPMSHETPTRPTRIIALDPTTKGFGYAILDLPLRLIAWGLAHISGEKRSGAVARFEALLDQFRPDAVVLEDATAPGSRRYPRMRDLIETLAKTARERGVAVYTVARLAVIACFSSKDERATKAKIAKTLAVAQRKTWQSEDERISIFDAVSLAVTFAST